MSFKGRISVLVGAALTCVAVLAAFSATQLRSRMVESRQVQLVQLVESAYSIAAAYQARANAGTLSVAQAQQAAKEALRLARFGADGRGYFYIFGLDGNGVMHPIRPEFDGQPLRGKVVDDNGTDTLQAIVDAARTSQSGAAFIATRFPRPGSKVAEPKLQYVLVLKDWNWLVGAGLYTNDVDAEVWSAVIGSLGIALAGLAVFSALSWLIVRSVTRQIGGEPAQAIAAMREVAHGNLSVRIASSGRGSVLGELAVMVASLRETVASVRQSIDHIASASSQIAAGSMDLSRRTELTAASLQQNAAAMEELSSSVTQTSASGKNANALAAGASQAATQGGVAMDEVARMMDSISDSSRRIGEVINVVNDIAFQTNILALNAAVEAARAGEQGRGFAVVASEVRKLAQRCDASSKEVRALITESEQRVEAGSALVGRAGERMQQIVQSVHQVDVIITEITNATVQQADGIGQINGAMLQIDQSTQQNAALVEETASAAESFKCQAQKLEESIQIFRLEAAPA